MNGFPILSVMLAVPALAAAACLYSTAERARWGEVVKAANIKVE